MATTNTVTSPATGVTLYSFTALANGDSFDFPGDYCTAKSILFQVTGGTFDSSTVALVGSLNGTNYAPLFRRNAIATGVAVETAVAAVAANAIVWDVQPCSKLRLTVTGGTGTGITANVVIVTL